jgi:hypothetical protein
MPLLQEEFEDTKGVIRIHKYNVRQHNGQKKRDKMTYNDLRNTTLKTIDRVTPTSLKIRVITKLPNSEQSYKGKVKTHNYINRQNQSTTGKL